MAKQCEAMKRASNSVRSKKKAEKIPPQRCTRDAKPGSRYCLWCMIEKGPVRCARLDCPADGFDQGPGRPRLALCAEDQELFEKSGEHFVVDFLAKAGPKASGVLH